ncbi:MULTISPECIES: ATP-binding cassette domain-containing protein [Shewanella]|jgi:phospholipid/cholesterol/gamma-HCH transport system ATP-binding protein|uniref:ATP-binding cassette domain-containing protein n=1 Tax=Shewanella vesiculosa TaxID=518738 RepID=A0ABV0FQK9_9GAMM|nr:MULTISPECIES: ATP-binding cassette domain-containing protein [Shewanella]NCQ45114.1 ATP-binding cassette domain-containing protein [Shewanella frigidimarina]MBB1323193.1 ATP-binding cassette domain-containing protein [Shewanella sp. SR43-8]NCO70898.1 ATP-binding cassette domain-containing protein [Shewanella vesiculosa]NCP37015.1 ATP-binding cassette domain-containing protein [Shewanella vesiculosa]NCP68892.1 ATP-binding cassette domain-containing protein [Shewanella vesiculosa]|tara:strand:- start:506 stop:1303 length:798 start_codon:yes stop_codon:yes gene_type:complete
MVKPIITVEHLFAQYGDTQVLKDVNLEVNPGEILVVMGGSGSGKSTLLNHMLGLKTPVSGTIMIDGVNIFTAKSKQLRHLRQKMGVAFQGGALLSSLTVADNVRLPLEQNTSLDTQTIDIMVRMKLELMNMAGTGHMMPSELSGGMLKRAGLARAVIMDPKLLFFDEPSAGLDPTTAVELDELILTLRDAMNMTIVVVTHELESVFKIADRVVVLFNGEVVANGTVDEIKNSPDERIQNMINRQPNTYRDDGEVYFNRLLDKDNI